MHFQSPFSFLIQFLSGFDIFISYRWRDAQPYVKALATELENKGFTCFIDVKGMTKGDLINNTLKRAIRKSTMFVVVVTDNVPSSVWIPQELAAFPSHKRKVVPINVDGAMDLLQLEHKPWDRLLNRDAIRESKANIIKATPSEQVTLEIERAFTVKRQEAVAAGKVFRLALAVATVVLIAAGFAVYQLREARSQQKIAALMTLDASLQRYKAEQKTAEADVQKKKADEQLAVANAQTKEANLQRKRAERATLRSIKEQVLAQAQKLSFEGERIRYDVSRHNPRATEQEAMAKYQEALRFFRLAGNINGEISSLQSILSLYGALTPPYKIVNQRERLIYFDQAERIYNKYRVGFGISPEQREHVLRNLANYYSEKNKLRSISYYLQLAPLYRQLNSTNLEFETFTKIARSYESLGSNPQQLAKARKHYQHALETYERTRGAGITPYLAGNVFDHLGDIHLTFGGKQEALYCYEKALEVFDKHCQYLERIACRPLAECMTQKINELKSGRRVGPCNFNGK